jgi:hypothetical protein
MQTATTRSKMWRNLNTREAYRQIKIVSVHVCYPMLQDCSMPSAIRNVKMAKKRRRRRKKKSKYFTLFEPCTVIYLCNNNQQNAHILHSSFNLIIVSSTCFEHPSVHPQADLYMQFYGISLMRPYKQSGVWQDVLDNVTNVHLVGSYYTN